MTIKGDNIQKYLLLILRGSLLFGIIIALWNAQWPIAFYTLCILVVTLLPELLGKRFDVHIPSEFELFAVIFVYGALFLGELRGFYLKYWWWDLALHTLSGFLLGLLGLLLVYVLNEKRDIKLHMTSGFVALFAFVFAVALGALWEIFEFSMDRLFGFNMQKAMWDDPSGLTDTMWDLIVDSIGAFVVALLGYVYFKTSRGSSFLERWIQRFIENNPHLFK
jgi:uncharacterized membrane protein YjdF